MTGKPPPTAGRDAPDDTRDPLARVLDGSAPAFALLHRPQAAAPDTVEVLLAETAHCATLADLPQPAHPSPHGGPELLALIPYRQITERGFTAHDDGEPLIAMTVTDHQTLPLAEALPRLPNEPVKIDQHGFDVSDRAYADIVRRVIAEEIGTGQGSNFVIKRTFTAWLPGFSAAGALSFYRRLLERERGAYWTFLVHTGDRVLLGATPERHISVRDGTAVMNPISGTYCYPAGGPTLDGVLSFLTDQKETDELYMVVDEELKMMARICRSGGRLIGPYLKEMAHLAHTEYLIEGHTDRDVREVLRETLLAPTVTGSPLENATRVISRHEPAGRGYYSGVAALIGRDAGGGRTLDSAILIRTADITADGHLRIGVGSTLVRHSDPEAEARETWAKASGLLAAHAEPAPARFATHPAVRAALAGRNARVAGFWLDRPDDTDHAAAELAGRRVLVVDAEDSFTAMLAHQVRSLGMAVSVRRFDAGYDTAAYDLVVLGPGPGDPGRRRDPRIAHLRSAVCRLLAERRPFLAVCLSHQVLCALLGLSLVRRGIPHQGVQREIDLFGRRERVAFYNTYTACAGRDVVEHPDAGRVTVSRDPDSGEVHALRARRLASVQFHAESVLTRGGPRIIGSLLTRVLRPHEPFPPTPTGGTDREGTRPAT
ncbi:anthranilate synthase family protein [Streptomyces sp. SAJ15]|uniref:anthranilate synthase family protein n=1 Tax=Streptomyces sp. SAJ15 TaxID=2011095 RepID=UPI001185864B|nr:anthranilate synthase family protein [Streptomyces sp. SAJ15]TVL91142.1 phenazine-specific anthranilate synthase component I [Streptomyces sp. SAJ15]